MSEAFNISGESSNVTAGPAPQLQSLFIPGIDDSQFIDGFGIVTPWGGGNTSRRYADYGIVTDRETQLTDLASSFIPVEGDGISYGLEGPQGIQGERGRDGIDGAIHVMGLNLPQNTNFLTDLPHNIDSINDLGTAANKLVYTESYTIVGGEIEAGDLGSGTTDGNTLGYSAEYEWEECDWTTRAITITPSVEIVKGKQYAIVIRADGDGEGGSVAIAGEQPGTYDYGSVYEQEDEETIWNLLRYGYPAEVADIYFNTGTDSYWGTPDRTYAGSAAYQVAGVLNDGSTYDYRKAMIFTASDSYTLSTVTLIMVRNFYVTPGTLTISIRNASFLYTEAEWAETDLTSVGKALLDDATAVAQATTLGLGTGDSPEFTGLTLSGIAAESSDVDKFLVVT